MNSSIFTRTYSIYTRIDFEQYPRHKTDISRYQPRNTPGYYRAFSLRISRERAQRDHLISGSSPLLSPSERTQRDTRASPRAPRRPCGCVYYRIRGYLVDFRYARTHKRVIALPRTGRGGEQCAREGEEQGTRLGTSVAGRTDARMDGPTDGGAGRCGEWQRHMEG